MSKLTNYSLDHEVRSSFEMGQLVPFLCQEVVPGDKYRVQSSSLVRLQPMLAPLMHRLDYYQRYYYVPYRLLIPNYEQLLTDPDSNQVVPTMDNYLVHSSKKMVDLIKEKPLLEYFGLATSNSDVEVNKVIGSLNALPLLAYYLIYNHYYMRSDLDSRYIDQLLPQHFQGATIKPLLGEVLNVNEGLDYFTSAKTSTQYGNMVELDMDGNSTITVPEMRLAERLQSFRERLMRVGGKYVNYIKEFFDVEPLDARVQIPKYLGGDKYVLNVSDVDQMAPSDKGAVGESYGKSVSVNRTQYVQYDVYEHGLIVGLHFVRPRPSNIGGCPKLFTRRTYFDFFNPHFSALGYQEIEARELDVSRDSSTPFGYVPRYDEYRYGYDIVSGDFRRSLNYWHLSRDISQEKLSVDFVTCRPDNRIFSYVGDGRRTLYRFRASTRIGLRGNNNVSANVDVTGCMWMPRGSVSIGSNVTVRSFFPKDIGTDNYVYDLVLHINDLEVEDYLFIDWSQDKSTSTSTYMVWSQDVTVRTLSTQDFIFSYNNKGRFKLSDLNVANCQGHIGSFVFCELYPNMNDAVGLDGGMADNYLRYLAERIHPVHGMWIGADEVSDASLVDNHVLAVTYNNVDVLRPLARYDGNVLK